MKLFGRSKSKDTETKQSETQPDATETSVVPKEEEAKANRVSDQPNAAPPDAEKDDVLDEEVASSHDQDLKSEDNAPDSVEEPQEAEIGSPSRRHVFSATAAPKTIEETDLSEAFLINLTCKIMNAGGTMTPAEIADVIKLPKLICRQLIKQMTSLSLIEAQGLESADIKSDVRYVLTDLGKKWASDAMMVSQYIGPAPVTLQAFSEHIRSQSIRNEEIHRNELDEALAHLVIPDILKAQLGPAVNSARSMLLYGEPGNGKTSLAEALGESFLDYVSFPYAILVGQQIIRFYDETLHETVEPPEDHRRTDARWVLCRRPVVLAGGELTLDMLDLRFDQMARFYEAPMHLKALGGIFVLDDFGRQAEKPQAYLNRWIVPLEKGFDILSLHTGKKFSVPFDQLVVFSSNLEPEELGDDAALRRIYFKIHVPSPTKQDYFKIFHDVTDNMEMEWKQDVMEEFFKRKYEEAGYVTSGAHPGFLVNHIRAACRYLESTPELSLDLLELAWRNVAASHRRDVS
ncbi:ATPase [Alisedimentitalea sp. MJ-SS2]|uniref:ATPase n=1 Tax=Aliisedimentitalea sp. MJ-SS2 TaxID=3049795 RepID=UPI002914DEE7|nr:ATPase [Alisedimentitalea sp. MJ-SS2]MDU8928286.1 ATPase [Alisedimentitalea sp. MJ-SS2]